MKEGISLIYKNTSLLSNLNYFKSMKLFIMFISLVYLLVAGICKAEQISEIPFNGQKNMNKPVRLRLIISQFEKISGDERYDFLKYSLPELVAIGLITNDRVEYISKQALRSSAVEKSTSMQFQQGIYGAFTEEMLEKLNIDLILKGSFSEYRGKISFDAILVDRKNKNLSIKISSKVVDVREIYSGVEQFVKKLNSEILALEAGKKAKQLAILCFRDVSDKPSDSNKWLKEDISISLMSLFKPRKDIRVLPWSQIKEFCKGEDIDIEEITNKIEADAILLGKFSISDNKISINPLLYFKKAGSHISLIPLSDNYKNLYRLTGSLAKDVNNVLDAIIVEEGQWNIEPLLFTSDDPAIYLKKGEEYLELKKNIYLATWMFLKAIDIKSDYSEAYYQLGLARVKQGRYEDALSEFEKSLENIKKRGIENKYLETKAYKSIGDVYLEQGKYEKAIEAFNKALEISPYLADIHFGIGSVYYIKGDAKEAINRFKDALKYAPNNPEIYNMLGRSYRLRRSNKEAENAYLKALKIDPTNNSTLFGISDIYKEEGVNLIREKKYKESLEIFDKAIKLDYPNSDIYFSRGYVYAELNKPEEAIKDYSRAIEIDPKDVDAYNSLCVVYVDLKYDYTKAYEMCEKAYNLEPDNILFLTNFVEINLLTERFDRAFVLANAAVKHKDISAEGKLSMMFISTSSLLFQGKRSDALSALKDFGKFYKGFAIYERSWEYGGSKNFISKTDKLKEGDRKLLLKMIEVLESPTKQEGLKKLEEVERQL